MIISQHQFVQLLISRYSTTSIIGGNMFHCRVQKYAKVILLHALRINGGIWQQLARLIPPEKLTRRKIPPKRRCYSQLNTNLFSLYNFLCQVYLASSAVGLTVLQFFHQLQVSVQKATELVVKRFGHRILDMEAKHLAQKKK